MPKTVKTKALRVTVLLHTLAMAAHDLLMADLQSLQGFFNAQKSVVKQESWHEMVQSQAKIYAARIGAISMTPEVGQRMAEALGEGCWPEAEKELLGNAIASGLQKQDSSRRRPSQSLTGMASYLTKADLECLQGEGHAMSKLACVVDRCLALGLHLPNENTIRHIIATVVDCLSEAK